MPLKVVCTNDFLKAVKRLPTNTKNKLVKQIEVLQQSPFSPEQCLGRFFLIKLLFGLLIGETRFIKSKRQESKRKPQVAELLAVFL